jgi:TadE-like protein
MNRSQEVRSRPARNHRRREGSLTLQMILVLPILVIVSIATIQIGFLVTLRQAVYHAATVGAREAAKGGDINHVVCVVNSILRPHSLAVGDCVSVILEDPAANPPVVQAGTAPCAPPATPVLSGNEVRVSVCVDLSKQSVGNALKSAGICAIGKGFRGSSLALKETPSQ